MKKFILLFVMIPALSFAQGEEADILLNGTVSAENNQIKNIEDPTDDQDAVTLVFLLEKLSYLQDQINAIQTLNPYPIGTVHCDPDNPTEVIAVLNPITGRYWMDRNLGASQVATSSTDENSYGDLYQWGRGADGHQCRDALTTTILSSTDQPENGLFILATSGPYDWRSPQNNNLWQGVEGVNNPCPTGYRIPTLAEFEEERSTWDSQNSIGAFGSVLKLTQGGTRNEVPFYVGGSGGYWSSTVYDGNGGSSGLNFGSYSTDPAESGAAFELNSRASGASIRCIKN